LNISYSGIHLSKDKGYDNCEKGNKMYTECAYIPRKYTRACGNYKKGDRGAQCSVQDRYEKAKDKQDAELEEADQTREGLKGARLC